MDSTLKNAQQGSGGFALLEVLMAASLVAFGLLGSLMVVFGLQRLNQDSRRAFLANEILTNQLARVRQEFSSATQYLTTYATNTAIPVSQSKKDALGGTADVQITAASAGSGMSGSWDRGVLLRLAINYGSGSPVLTDSIEFLMRCDRP